RADREDRNYRTGSAPNAWLRRIAGQDAGSAWGAAARMARPRSLAAAERGPAGVRRRWSAPSASSAAADRPATRTAPAKTCTKSRWLRPSTMNRPRPPQPTSAARVAVATTWTGRPDPGHDHREG